MNIKLDNFIISIDVSGDKLASAALLITKAAESVKIKIHIIDFSDVGLKSYFTIDNCKSEEFIENTQAIIKKILFVDSSVKSFEWLEKYLSQLTEQDYLFLIRKKIFLRVKLFHKFKDIW